MRKQLLLAVLLIGGLAMNGQDSIFSTSDSARYNLHSTSQNAFYIQRISTEGYKNHFVDVGGKVIKIQVNYQDEQKMSSFINAVNIATETGMLHWEKMPADTVESYPSKFIFYTEDLNNSFVLGIFEHERYYARKGEIVVGNQEERWKAKNETLLIFLRKYFFGF